MTGTAAFRKTDLVPRPDKGPNKYTIISHIRPNSIVSINPDGSVGAVSNDTNPGEYQLFTMSGSTRVAVETAGIGSGADYPTGCFAFPLVEEL